jgi:hypothetical protein
MMQNKSAIAGILSIIAGTLGICGLSGAWYGRYLARFMFETVPYEFLSDTFYGLITAHYFIVGSISALLGILAVLGGIFALQKRLWGLALAGAISSVFTFFPLGIAAVIFVAQTQKEFSSPPSDNAELVPETVTQQL